jgi:hypothetical protein
VKKDVKKGVKRVGVTEGRRRKYVRGRRKGPMTLLLAKEMQSKKCNKHSNATHNTKENDGYANGDN